MFVAAFSDAVDGLLARTLHQKSALGAYLDPIADKLLLSSSFVILAMAKKVAWWLTLMILSRDVLLLACKRRARTSGQREFALRVLPEPSVILSPKATTAPLFP